MAEPVETDPAPIPRFEAFAWPVPSAFAGAIAASRFELGDVLYTDPGAYAALAGSLRKGSRAIQVLHPPRGTRGTLTENDNDRRAANWTSEVRIEWIDLSTGEREQRTLSQGKLVMALWTGDEDWLTEAHPQPDLPRSLRELHAALGQTTAALADHAARVGVASGSQFALGMDLAGDASRAKAGLVAEALRATGPVQVVDLTPRQAGVEQSEAFHPTLVLRVFTLEGRSSDAIEPVLRSCLYRGGQGAADPTKSGDEASDVDARSSADGGRFSIARHGLLVEI